VASWLWGCRGGVGTPSNPMSRDRWSSFPGEAKGCMPASRSPCSPFHVAGSFPADDAPAADRTPPSGSRLAGSGVLGGCCCCCWCCCCGSCRSATPGGCRLIGKGVPPSCWCWCWCWCCWFAAPCGSEWGCAWSGGPRGLAAVLAMVGVAELGGAATCGKLRKWSGLEVTLGSALRAWSPSCCAVEGAAATAESAAEEAGWPRALETGAAGEL